jgi:hypothetical protein
LGRKETEGVGLLPAKRKALKINARSSRDVSHDYCTSVTVGKSNFSFKNAATTLQSPLSLNEGHALLHWPLAVRTPGTKFEIA